MSGEDQTAVSAGFTVSGSMPTHARRAAEPQTLARGEVLAGRYEIQRPLGSGAASQVFQAYDRATKSAVALKVMVEARDGDPAWRERLGRELRLAREVRHPHICDVYDLEEADGHPFLTMALASRGNLRDTLDARAPYPWTERLADLRGVLSGLAALHAAGIVHRDVKPANVLRMQDGRVVLSDFGLARGRAQNTQETSRAGTPAYMAPELLAAESASPRSDVWAVGIVMHEALFGARPGRPDDRTTPDRGVTRRERRARRRLRALCEWCLRLAPDQRPRDAGEVLKAFDRATGGSLAVAWRSRWVLVLSAAGGLAAVVALLSLRAGDPSGVRELRATGEPPSLAGHVRTIASFGGRVHCLSALPDGSVGVVWGDPRRAERVILQTGVRVPWNVPPQSYEMPRQDIALPDPKENNCPQIAPDGVRLLYSGTTPAGQRAVFLQKTPVSPPVFLSGGDLPVWHPNEEIIALRVDQGHAGIYDLTTRKLSVLPDPARPGQRGFVFVLQTQFVHGGRGLLVRSADESGYDIIHYDLAEFRATKRVFLPHQPTLFVRLTLADDPDELLVQVTSPRGSYALAWLDLRAGRLHWLGDLEGMDIVASARAVGAGRVLIARRWTSDFQVMRGRTVVRTIVTDTPGKVGDVNAAGDVLITSLSSGGAQVMLYPADGSAPRRIGPGPAEGDGQFLADGKSVTLVHMSGRANDPDVIMMCTLAGSCRTVGAAPSVDYPALSPKGDRVAYIGFKPTEHLALLTVLTGRTRILSPSLYCPPRWLGDKLWVARGSAASFDWVELDSESGQPTGRRVTGAPGCRAANAGPENVLEERLRLIEREDSYLMALDSVVDR